MTKSVAANCRKVVCIGRNFADHIAELNNATPSRPFFFLKPPSSILEPGVGPILRPQGVLLHFEVELGLVMGKTIRDLDPLDHGAAVEAIDSYILTIDMTARNVQNEAKEKQLPWTIAKGFDTFLPISQRITKEQIPDPHNIILKLFVDGQVRQLDSTSLMLFQIPRQLADISSVMTLEAGDIVLTGTPKGVGEVKSGQVMTAEIVVEGQTIPESLISVAVEDRVGRYEFGQE